MPRAAPASYPRPLSGSASREQSTSTHTSLFFFAPGRKRTAILFLHPRGELRNISTESRLGEEPTRHYPNRGSFPGGVHLSALVSQIPAAGRAPRTPRPERSARRSLELHTHRCECRIVRAHGSCARGWKVAHVFLLKFKTCCTERPELMKGKLTLRKEKVQCWVAFLCHLRLKKCF